MNFDPSRFDPSKLDPKVLMELSQMVRELPPDKIAKMQTLMHNMMAGHDVSREMADFEKGLPPGFQERIMRAMGGPAAAAQAMQGEPSEPSSEQSRPIGIQVPSSKPDVEVTAEMNMHQARLTVLRGVASGQLTPEEAEKLLFQA